MLNKYDASSVEIDINQVTLKYNRGIRNPLESE